MQINHYNTTPVGLGHFHSNFPGQGLGYLRSYLVISDPIHM